MRRRAEISRALLTIAFLLFLSLSGPGRSQASEEYGGPLRHVENKDVCMVADRVPGEPTVEVRLDGKRFYVCCENCEARLRKTREIRFASDPVTGRRIDKARAFIVARDTGAVIYFESRKTAGRYFNNHERRSP